MQTGIPQQAREKCDDRHDEDIGEHGDQRAGQPILRIALRHGKHRAEDEGRPDREQQGEAHFRDEKEPHRDEGHHDRRRGADRARDEE